MTIGRHVGIVQRPDMSACGPLPTTLTQSSTSPSWRPAYGRSRLLSGEWHRRTLILARRPCRPLLTQHQQSAAPRPWPPLRALKSQPTPTEAVVRPGRDLTRGLTGRAGRSQRPQQVAYRTRPIPVGRHRSGSAMTLPGPVLRPLRSGRVSPWHTKLGCCP